MRKTKFRAQDFFTDDWIYGMSVKDGDVKGRWHIYFNFGDAAICKPETIGEFTGLKDKNRKEYFEGDILKTNGGRLGSVAYHTERGLWIFHDTENYNEPLHEFAATSEIVGNIHEHQTLLTP